MNWKVINILEQEIQDCHEGQIIIEEYFRESNLNSILQINLHIISRPKLEKRHFLKQCTSDLQFHHYISDKIHFLVLKNGILKNYGI